MNGWGWFFLILLLIVLVYGGWAGYRFYSAKRQGLPPPPLKAYIPFVKSGQSSTNYPSPRTANPLEWIKDQIAKLRNRRTHQGAYEEAGAAESGYASVGGAGAGVRRGRGVEDDAWDTRLGNEDPYGASGPGGYYEEQELGLASTPGYATDPAAYTRNTDYMQQSTSYGGPQQGGRASRNLGVENPFGDQHEAGSVRSVSPRPEIDTSRTHRKDNTSLDSTHSSPTSIRKSHFQEEDMR